MWLPVLDLRAQNPQLAQAALRAIVLDRASAVHNGPMPVHKIGVYAVPPIRAMEVIENINLLRKYSDDLINWEDRTDREGLKRLFFNAYNAHLDSPATDNLLYKPPPSERRDTHDHPPIGGPPSLPRTAQPAILAHLWPPPPNEARRRRLAAPVHVLCHIETPARSRQRRPYRSPRRRNGSAGARSRGT